MTITEVINNVRHKTDKHNYQHEQCPYNYKFVAKEKYHFWLEEKGRGDRQVVCPASVGNSCSTCKKFNSKEFTLVPDDVLKKNNTRRG